MTVLYLYIILNSADCSVLITVKENNIVDMFYIDYYGFVSNDLNTIIARRGFTPGFTPQLVLYYYIIKPTK